LDGETYASILLSSAHTLTFGLSGRADIVNADLFGRHVGYGAAVYGQDEWKLSENLIATLGARYDYQALGLSQPSGQFNPKAAVSYAPSAGTTLHASAGRGFRMPSVAEMFLAGEVSTLVAVPNTGLNPERSYSYEAGISQLAGDWGKVEGAAFRSDFADLIEAGLVVSSGDLPFIQWRNVTKARVQGFETSVGLGLFRGDLKLNAGYTYVYPEDLTKNDLLKYRPRHILYSNIQARLGPLTGGIDFRYISRVERIDEELIDLGIVPDGDERVPIYVTDMRIGGTINLAAMRLAATVNVNNVFQRNYVELIGNLMPPRTYVLTLEAQF
jgi:iron complex outermembrane receptor protein